MEYAGLWFDIRLIIKGARRHEDLPGITHFPGQWPAAVRAEGAREALCIGEPVGLYMVQVTGTGELAVADKHIAGMAGTGGFPTA
jgi:hypothetical protein